MYNRRAARPFFVHTFSMPLWLGGRSVRASAHASPCAANRPPVCDGASLHRSTESIPPSGSSAMRLPSRFLAATFAAAMVAASLVQPAAAAEPAPLELFGVALKGATRDQLRDAFKQMACGPGARTTTLGWTPMTHRECSMGRPSSRPDTSWRLAGSRMPSTSSRLSWTRDLSAGSSIWLQSNTANPLRATAVTTLGR